jgi:hypothetical protein
MLTVLPEFSIAAIILSEIIPTLTTIIVGGFFAAYVFPRLQYKFDITKHNNQRRRELSEEILRDLEKYISDWRRLITISTYGQEKLLTKEEIERKEGFFLARNEARDKLLGDMRSGRLYFSSNTNCLIDKFLTWDENQTSLGLSKLPEISAWRVWQVQLTEALSKELVKRPHSQS